MSDERPPYVGWVAINRHKTVTLWSGERVQVWSARIICPYCGMTHHHGAESEIGGLPDAGGHRVPHCWDDPEPLRRALPEERDLGYILADKPLAIKEQP